ncbi:MAG: bifunctional (p)ppGpp synthetase/guanosine-3',5'-bis(diphosphate) 3'-pyrophosphohydrolase, partial [Deltaproteobacteria bacterium]|nr:bifunctional (p)ppGpp synthetase/guanosine-3',5'-bis(diphosphate) 3'-pyrophosphohydrolase [Deltaproteobacteria bacterium]
LDDAYRFAMQLFSGQFRGSGKPFLCHLVGTASVLAALSAPTPIVAAGLLHAAYTLGNFGSGWLGINAVKRRAVREKVGDTVEDLVKRYAELEWHDETPAEVLDRLSRGEPIDRDAILIRLANEVDEHLDLGILYCKEAAQRVRRAARIQQPCVALAERLGYAALAAAVQDSFRLCTSGSVPSNLRQNSDLSFTLPVLSRARWRLRRLRYLLRRTTPGE